MNIKKYVKTEILKIIGLITNIESVIEQTIISEKNINQEFTLQRIEEIRSYLLR